MTTRFNALVDMPAVFGILDKLDHKRDVFFFRFGNQLPQPHSLSAIALW